MASARVRTRVETPHIRPSNARRQLAVRQQLNRELDSRMSVLNQRRRYRDTALMTLAALSVVLCWANLWCTRRAALTGPTSPRF